jgi:hypothetical protein
MFSKRLAAVVIAAGALCTVSAIPSANAAATHYKNCSALNKVYPHGVGKPGAVDHVRGATKPVVNFKRSAALYMANASMDRDKDGVACEKR